MSKKEAIFILYDLGISLRSLSILYREADEEQLIQLINGNFLDLQFSLGIFNDKEIKLLSSFEAIKHSQSNVYKTLEEFSKEDTEYFVYFEEGYPAALKTIPTPPFLIFMRGNREVLKNRFICSIVGTRNPSDKTLNQIESTVKEMVQAGIVIGSGLAIGTDIQAHKSTLKFNGETLAVLPSPIKNVTPKSHKHYAEEILEKNGLLISEYYKSDLVFKKSNYIHRNRIVSGLSNAVIIAECSEKSGTMHTARYAYKQNRPIYCFDNRSTGVQKILSSHSAKIYTGLDDFNKYVKEDL